MAQCQTHTHTHKNKYIVNVPLCLPSHTNTGRKKWSLSLRTDCNDCRKWALLFLCPSLFCAAMSPYSVLKPNRTREMLQRADSLWTQHRPHMAPVALEAHLRKLCRKRMQNEFLHSAAREKCQRPNYSLISVSSLSNHVAQREGEIYTTWTSQQQSGRTVNNISWSNLSYEHLKPCRCCLDGRRTGRAQDQHKPGSRLSFASISTDSVVQPVSIHAHTCL